MTATRFGEPTRSAGCDQRGHRRRDTCPRPSTAPRRRAARRRQRRTGGDAGRRRRPDCWVRVKDDLLLLIDGIPAAALPVPQSGVASKRRAHQVMRSAPVLRHDRVRRHDQRIHYAAGRADRTASLRYGSYNSTGLMWRRSCPPGECANRSAAISDDSYPIRARARPAQGSWRRPPSLGWHRLPTWTCWRFARSPPPCWRSRNDGQLPRGCPWI